MQAAEELCDRVAFIIDGQIKLINSPRELKLLKGNKRLMLEYRQHNELQQAEFSLDGIGENQQFLQLIREHPIETIHSLEASLEQIFINVTGRSLV
ncbi:Fluoroquinolones export ATP-binding protein [compost metagenome]